MKGSKNLVATILDMGANVDEQVGKTQITLKKKIYLAIGFRYVNTSTVSREQKSIWENPLRGAREFGKIRIDLGDILPS